MLFFTETKLFFGSDRSRHHHGSKKKHKHFMETGQLEEGLLYLKPSGNGFTCSGFVSLSEIHLHRRRMFVGQICYWQNLKTKLYIRISIFKRNPNTSRDMATGIEMMLPFKHVQTTNRRMIHTIYKSKGKL